MRSSRSVPTSFVLVCAAALAATPAAEAGENLFANGEFARADGDGRPAGWAHKGEGTVTVHADGEQAFARLGVSAAGQSSFLEQWIDVPSDAVSLELSVRLRWRGIRPGRSGYMRGKVQGRFKTADGANAGHWVDLASVADSSDGWVVHTREAAVPDSAAKLMMRAGFYEVQAGRLDVAELRAEAVTRADVAAERAKYRPGEPYGPEVADARFARLQRGININGWFCQPWNQRIDGRKGEFAPWFLRAYITDDDLEMIRGMGFAHVRLPVDPIAWMDTETGELKTGLLGELDAAVARILRHGLAVVVDAHPKNHTFKALRKKPLLARRFVTWWGRMAGHLAETTDPQRVFLELLNEPGGQHYWADETWEAYQDRLITAVRAAAPKHTLIANGGAYMLVKELGKVRPHPDRNVVWSVHYYEPSPFTHQGAPWMKAWYRPLNEVPWPLTEADLAGTIAKLKEHKARDQAAQVLRDQVTRATARREHIVEQMGRIADWAKRNGRRIYIGEWGAVDYAPRASRLRYLAAVREAMNARGFGWAMWNYSGSAFSAVKGEDHPGARERDAELLAALGLSSGNQPVK